LIGTVSDWGNSQSLILFFFWLSSGLPIIICEFTNEKVIIMKLSNIGIEGLCDQTVDQDDGDVIFECLSLENELELLKEQNVAFRRQSLKDFAFILDTVGSARSSITGHFLSNADFVAQYGKDSSKWAAKMREQMAAIDGVDISTEGQKIQDFFRWGIEGLLAGLYLKSLTRIERVLSKRVPDLVSGRDTVFLRIRSQYLPDYAHANKLITGMIKLQKLIDGYVKNPKSVSMKSLAAVLHEIGIIDGKSADTKTDWEISLKSFILRVVGGTLTSGALSPTGALVGMLVSDAGIPIGKRGWTSANFTDFAKKMLDLVRDSMATAKSAKQTAKQVLKGDDREANEVASVMKKCIGTHKELVSMLGRGTCAAHNGWWSGSV
jgi:hypothetical protein